MMDWVKKNRDWLVTLAIFLTFVVLLTFTGLFLKKCTNEKEPSTTMPTESGTSVQNTPNGNMAAEKIGTHSFFLTPSAAEILQKLEELDYHKFKAETEKLPGLRVMWPAYFFAITKKEANRAEILLDASEDGFGATMVTEIDLQQYPQINTLSSGKKIWIAGEITGVDPTGTGRFFLKTQYVRFDDGVERPTDAQQ